MASGWNLWVWLVGVVVRRYRIYCRYPHNNSGVGTLEISGGIYNTASFLQKDSCGKTQISLLVKRRRWVVWRSHAHFREGVATLYIIIIKRVGGERAFLFNAQRLRFAVYNGRHCIIIDM